MSSTSKPTCFVISPFGEPFDSYFSRIIKPALDDCGFYAARGDSLFRPSTIMDDIWLGIREAKLLVAELTGRNPNVFYELGLAHAISKPVVLIATSMDDVPFDLRSIRVLLYNKDDPEWGAKLRSEITQAVKEVTSDPLLAIPTTYKTPVSAKVPQESEVLLRIARLENHVDRLIAQNLDIEIEPPTPSASGAVKVGDTVVHARFGRGVVLEAAGTGGQYRVRVDFESLGVKWLLVSYANLQVVK